MSRTPFSNVNNIHVHSMIPENQKNMTTQWCSTGTIVGDCLICSSYQTITNTDKRIQRCKCLWYITMFTYKITNINFIIIEQLSLQFYRLTRQFVRCLGLLPIMSFVCCLGQIVRITLKSHSYIMSITSFTVYTQMNFFLKQFLLTPNITYVMHILVYKYNI